MQIHVFFKLPDEFGTFPCPLAYVSWFTAFQTLPVDGIGMYKIARSTRAHQRRASIIPVTDIVRSCHLIPGFGSARAQDLGWTTDTVLKEAPYFYLNPYLRHHDFLLLRYSVDLYQDQLARRAQEIAAKRARGIRPRRPYVIGRP